MKFNPPFDMQVPVRRVNGHFEVCGDNPRLSELDVDPRRFDVFLVDGSRGFVAQRKSRTLAIEENNWSG